MTVREGDLIAGRYRLLRELGSGGMGVVWRARDDKTLMREVAVKGIKESHPTARDRLLREARAAGGLKHSGIITVHDVVIENGQPWIVMELIEGPSVARMLVDRDRLPEQRAAQIGVKVLEALGFAHQHAVLHRDVKPGNILIDGGRVVVTDFGIAAIEDDLSLTETNVRLGTPKYMAPECVNGFTATAESDLWSFGIMLYEMAAGRTPFERATRQATEKAICDDAPSQGEIDQLWPVIQGLLRKNPAERLRVDVALAMLKPVAGSPAPEGPLDPTLVENPSGQNTVLDDTLDKTPVQAPAFLPMPPRLVAPGDVTAEPMPPRKTRSTTTVVWAIIAAVVVAAAIVIPLSLQSSPPATQNSSPPPTVPSLRSYQEQQLGFTISVPDGWERTPSTVSETSDVAWQDKQIDPKVGTLQVQVRRDDKKPIVTAFAYLSGQDRDGQMTRNNYERLALTGLSATTAELEYTYSSEPGDNHYHVLSRATNASKSIFVLTFTLYAADVRVLREQWQAAQPAMTAIRGSFKVDPPK